MSKKYTLGLIAVGLISMSSALISTANAGTCGTTWCDNYIATGMPTLHNQNGEMLSYQHVGHALLCGHYVNEK
jgi:hypothetical protein